MELETYKSEDPLLCQADSLTRQRREKSGDCQAASPAHAHAASRKKPPAKAAMHLVFTCSADGSCPAAETTCTSTPCPNWYSTALPRVPAWVAGSTCKQEGMRAVLAGQC